MIKSILVTLDESQSSESAKKLSVNFAKLYKTALTGIGVLDEPWIAVPEAIPLGGAAFKVELDEQLLKDAKHHVHKVEKKFMAYCQNQDMPCSIIDAIGIPTCEIEHFMTEHDLLIMGKDSNFHFATIEETSISVKQIIQDNPRPIIVTGPSLPHQDSSDILVAYDGTFASSRALHMALLMGIFKKRVVHIASVSPHAQKAREHVNIAAKLCQNHEIKAHLHPFESNEKPAKVLLALGEDLKPSLIIMGAFGHGGISYFFRGSCAKTLLKSTDIPLFIYH